MKYSNVEPDFDDNPNISKRSPLKTFLLIIAGLLGSFLVFYTIIILLLNFFMPRLPEEYEVIVSNVLVSFFDEEDIDKEKTLVTEEILKELSDDDIKILVIKSEIINAMALPGNIIIVYSALYDKVSEDGLRFVIGHEIGHLVNNDNMKLLGRSSLRTIFSESLFDEPVSTIIDKSLYLVSLAFSRSDETNADIYSINLLKSKGFSTNGAYEFFNSVNDDKEDLSIYLSTHPHPKKRLKEIEKVEGN